MSTQEQSRDDGSALRDARLAQALKHAPDAHMRPDAKVRQSVLKAAQDALAQQGAAAASTSAAELQPRDVSWLDRLFGRKSGKGREEGGSGYRSPWGAGLASVLIAGFVTVLWYDKPVPDAATDAGRPAQEIAPVVPAQAPPAAAPAAAPSTQPQVAQPPIEQPDAVEARRDAEALRDSMTRGRAESAGASVQKKAEESAGFSANKAAGEAPRVAPAVAAPAQAPVVIAPLPPPAPPPAPAPRPTSRSAASTAADSAPAVPDRWTQLRLALQPDAAPLTRADAGAVPELLRRLGGGEPASAVAAAGSAAAPAARMAQSPRAASGIASQSQSQTQTQSESTRTRPPIRLELVENGNALGVLEITESEWTFTPSDAIAARRSGRLDSTTYNALRAELARVEAARPR